ncbi:uncharacterized protein BDR25DRAFT_352133 [Lindgomyces ingoldianus]|uniref:Uncharacterized protein n=1 Tax=Lindgomyces ingoldianus TaxID=673940 RepID=A0ACB6R317_9PLEO|nr:uncharacterized protein BDR25DRAFT_352133 [Lindgomyces ingoldianus]KAF2473639.1 hypothetical protein BDR25DRAFT_352133 [Lindgomyces ingoldianus]
MRAQGFFSYFTRGMRNWIEFIARGVLYYGDDASDHGDDASDHGDDPSDHDDDPSDYRVITANTFPFTSVV